MHQSSKLRVSVLVVIEEDADGYYAYALTLKGCT